METVSIDLVYQLAHEIWKTGNFNIQDKFFSVEKAILLAEAVQEEYAKLKANASK